MPLMKPEVSSILKKAGIGPKGLTPNFSNSRGDINVSSSLNNAGLSVDDLALELAELVKNGDTDTVRHNAINTALKAHGIMKDEGSSAAVINININDPEGSGYDINPILIPRQLNNPIEIKAIED